MARVPRAVILTVIVVAFGQFAVGRKVSSNEIDFNLYLINVCQRPSTFTFAGPSPRLSASTPQVTKRALVKIS